MTLRRLYLEGFGIWWGCNNATQQANGSPKAEGTPASRRHPLRAKGTLPAKCNLPAKGTPQVKVPIQASGSPEGLAKICSPFALGKASEQEESGVGQKAVLVQWSGGT